MPHTRIGEEPLSPSTINRWIVASQQINLRDPVRSIRRHRQARTRMIVVIVALAVVAVLAVRWLWPRIAGLF